jgi:hypothetical protein
MLSLVRWVPVHNVVLVVELLLHLLQRLVGTKP